MENESAKEEQWKLVIEAKIERARREWQKIREEMDSEWHKKYSFGQNLTREEFLKICSFKDEDEKQGEWKKIIDQKLQRAKSEWEKIMNEMNCEWDKFKNDGGQTAHSIGVLSDLSAFDNSEKKPEMVEGLLVSGATKNEEKMLNL